jgi:hypothetical protein
MAWIDPATRLERNAAGDLLLHIALFADYPDCVELVVILLRRWPESAHAAGADWILPLHTAIRMRKPCLVFDHHAPPCTRSIDSQGRTPMHAVAATNSPCPGDVDLLIAYWPKSLLLRDVKGDLPLHVAAHNFSPFYRPTGMSEVEKMLNHFLGTIQIDDANGKLPLHIAVSSGFLFFRSSDSLWTGSQVGERERLERESPSLSCGSERISVSQSDQYGLIRLQLTRSTCPGRAHSTCSGRTRRRRSW